KPDVRFYARESLFRLLPTLSIEHYGHLQAQTVPNLGDLLTSDRYFHTSDCKLSDVQMLQVLEALGKVGDGRVIRAVELSKREKNPQIQQAADSILPILQERQRLAEAPRNLLRASHQPIAISDVLLRPALETGDTQPEQLLRATSSPANAE